MWNALVCSLTVLMLVVLVAMALRALRRALGRGLAWAALGLAWVAEWMLADDAPAAAKLDLGTAPGPSVQDVALLNGTGWQLIELSLN